MEQLRDLPTSVLEEIADFVQFKRQRAMSGKSGKDAASLQTLLSELSADSTEHMNEEWRDYEQRYPSR